jgi:hypothetical protein
MFSKTRKQEAWARMNLRWLMLVAVPAVAVSACASRAVPEPAPTVLAPEKEYKLQGEAQPWKIGGIFHRYDKSIAITVNGDSVMKANFPPYTPKLTAWGRYNGEVLSAVCTFATDVISSDGRGRAGIAQMVVQKSAGYTSNTCDVSVNGQLAVTLYF